MGQLRLNLLVTVLVGLLPVLSYGGAEEPPPPSEGICYKVFYEANFKELIQLRPHDYSSKISECIASTVISDMKYFKCECKKVEDAKFCQQVVAKKGTFKNVEMYAAAVAYHCEKMSRLKMNEYVSSPNLICFRITSLIL